MFRKRRGVFPMTVVLATTTVLTACSAAPDDDRVTVLAAFYPLQFAAERVGGDRVRVESLTTPGAEPHDVELSPLQVAQVADADLVLYIKGFQPAVDAAVEQQAGDRAVDVSAGIDRLTAASATDPHVWLDPLNMVAVADTIAQRLGSAAPDQRARFAANNTDLAAELGDLDASWSAGTRTCANRSLVVSHEAFGYLADRYGFEQVGISGLSPEIEPSPAAVARVTEFVRDQDVRTVYFETLVDPTVARTVAAETGARTAVLDPIEAAAAGQTYLTLSEQNLRTVRAGQPCR